MTILTKAFDPKEAKILLVDDSLLNLELLKHTLKAKGYASETASGGQEALEMLSENEYDLVLLDIMMPVLDGFAVLERIRSNEKTQELPVIFLTALNDTNSKVKGLGLGANDFVTKPFNPAELVARVNTHLHLKFLNKRIRKQHEEIATHHQALLKDLSSAQKIQLSLLPREYPKSTTLSFTAEYVPCAKVGGDLYDVFRLDNDHVGVYICDVSGHGVPAAMITVFIKQSFNSFLSQPSSPARLSPRKAIESINRAFVEEGFGDYYATIFYAVINEKTLEMVYSNAAHNGRPYILSNDREVVEIGHNALAVGWFSDAEFIEEKVQLQKGNRIVFYTDGIIESTNGNGGVWGSAQFREFIRAHASGSSDSFCVNLLKTIEAFSGKKEQEDDIALLLVDVL